MNRANEQVIRVLYSFPHKLGADRICTTAWYQVTEVSKAGAQVTVFPGALSRTVPRDIVVEPTLAYGKLRIPYSVLGSMRAFALHDYITAQRLIRIRDRIDIVHVWPLGALNTLRVARQLRIPAVLERPNAHTAYAYDVVKKECDKLGVALPANHEHAYKPAVLDKEEKEYQLATKLLCPSNFVARTFLERGFQKDALARHQYGFDEKVYFPSPAKGPSVSGLKMLFVGGCAPRKGLHYALEAWLRSSASTEGEFVIAGAFVPGYAEVLSQMLSHPSVRVLGHRTDIPELMRKSDLLILPTIEEGSALVTSEARGSGCVILVSEAAGAICEHMSDSLVHKVGDVDQLTSQIEMLNRNRELLGDLRRRSLDGTPGITWSAAGRRLLDVYRQTLGEYRDAVVPA